MRGAFMPSCLGLSRLFDSTDPIDHAEAAQICATCPALDACRKLLEDAMRDFGYGPYVGPRGTWAGRFLNSKPRLQHATCGTISGKRRHARNDEPVCDACRVAAATYNRQLRAQKRAAA